MKGTKGRKQRFQALKIKQQKHLQGLRAKQERIEPQKHYQAFREENERRSGSSQRRSSSIRPVAPEQEGSQGRPCRHSYAAREEVEKEQQRQLQVEQQKHLEIFKGERGRMKQQVHIQK